MRTKTIIAWVLVLALALGVGPVAAKETVKVAFISPLTGGVSAIGVGGRNSADLAVRLIAEYIPLLKSSARSGVEVIDLVRLMRAVDLVPGGAATVGSGYQPGLALSPDGALAYVSSFNAGTLHVLSLPADIALGEIGVDEDPFDAIGALASSPGALAAPAGAIADLFFVVNGTFDSSFLPLGSSYVGTLTAE